MQFCAQIARVCLRMRTPTHDPVRMERFLRNPRNWLPPALASELTPRAGTAVVGIAHGASAAVVHAVRNWAQYADPISNGEAIQLLKGAAAAHLLNPPDLPDGLMLDLLAEGDDWDAEGLPDHAASADADALDLLNHWVAVGSLSTAGDGFAALLRAEQIVESISARVFEKRAGEALFGATESLSCGLSQAIVLAGRVAAQSWALNGEASAHWLAARLYRRRHAAVGGFLYPFRHTAERLTAAHQHHLDSVSGWETVNCFAAALKSGRVDDNLLAALRVYLSEAAAIRSGTAAPPWSRSASGDGGGSPGADG